MNSELNAIVRTESASSEKKNVSHGEGNNLFENKTQRYKDTSRWKEKANDKKENNFLEKYLRQPRRRNKELPAYRKKG